MRQFAQKGFRIEQLSLEAKLLYTAFLLFSLAALFVSVLYYSDLVGDRPFAGAREYYAGEAPASPAASTELSEGLSEGGPELFLPDEVVEHDEASPMLLSMTRRKLLEVTHFHLFTLPIFLLVIAHIFMLCRMRPAFKLGWIGSAITSSAVHLLAPWLIFWGGSGWAWLMPTTGAWMSVSMIILIVWPAFAMWRPSSKR